MVIRANNDGEWSIPEPKKSDPYAIWRNTRQEHRSGKRNLVVALLQTAFTYAKIFPGEKLIIGDLDAPGPRHQTHREGIDADVYLPGRMRLENTTGHRPFPNNYRDADPGRVDGSRKRVLTLAKVLATCTQGNLRIYYNDEKVKEDFLDWYKRQGYSAPMGPPMQEHNELHGFHFHVTVKPSLQGRSSRSVSRSPRKHREG